MTETLTASSIPDLLKAAEKTTEKGWPEAWWRGHADSTWDLVPKVFRKTDADPRVEMFMILRFQAGAGTRYHRACPGADEIPAWLSLMQHYGLPTRLLDWTTSILAAAYFAAEPLKDREKEGTIWGFSPNHLNRKVADIDGILMPGEENAKALFDAAISGYRSEPGKAVAVAPLESDLRMTVQQSMFTVHGSAARLDTLFEQNDDWPFLKVTVPASAKVPLLMSLDALGIRRSTLFPDLQSLAGWIEDYYGYRS